MRSDKTIDRALHIAMVARVFSDRGGLELYTYKLVQGLLDLGHRVTVICNKDETKEIKGSTSENLKVIAYGDGKKRKKADAMRWDLLYAAKTVKEAGDFDIVHSQHFPFVYQKDNLVVTYHNHTAGRLSQVGYPMEKLLNQLKMQYSTAYRLRDQYDWTMTRKAAMRIFVSDILRKDFYTTYGIDQARPHAIAYPGAGLAEINTNETGSQVRDDRYFNFLFVGKGFRKKGVDTLIAAMDLLAKRSKANFGSPMPRLLIAGVKEKLHDKLYRKLARLEGEVRYLGFCKDMAAVYGQAQALVLPSKVEPFGMVPIQAMQYGLPTIVSRVSGVSEVLRDEVDSLILKDHLSAEELAELMARLMEDTELYARLSAQARSKAQDLTWQKTVQATLEAYLEVLKNA